MVIKVKTIINNDQNEIIIKNSRFITHILKVYQLKEIDKYLNDMKKQYKKADHYCYAYKIDNLIKCNDDNEPSGTAGTPILDNIIKKNLNHILIIVIRYFGGIKLGTGPLYRAYNKASSSVIKNTNLIKDIRYINVELTIPYEQKTIIYEILEKKDIKDIIYQERITYIACIPEELLKILQIKKIDYKIL